MIHLGSILEMRYYWTSFSTPTTSIVRRDRCLYGVRFSIHSRGVAVVRVEEGDLFQCIDCRNNLVEGCVAQLPDTWKGKYFQSATPLSYQLVSCMNCSGKSGPWAKVSEDYSCEGLCKQIGS
jgi:hypothetical protein